MANLLGTSRSILFIDDAVEYDSHSTLVSSYDQRSLLGTGFGNRFVVRSW